MTVEIRTKTIVTVAEMSRMCGLSRARFYQLVKEAVFPSPLYRIETRRPFYTEEMQEVCLEVRRRNCGINGKPIMFYARRNQVVSTPKKKRTPVKKMRTTNNHNGLIEGLKGLGLTTMTASQVESAVEEFSVSRASFGLHTLRDRISE